MNTKKAMKILREQGISVEQDDKNFILEYKGFDFYETLSGRELIKYAKNYTSENNRNTSFKSSVKHFDNRKNRQATREKLSHEMYDDIPQNGKVKQENIWNWD